MPVRLRPSTFSQSSSVVSQRGASGPVMPALFTRTSTAPKDSRARSTSARTSSGLVTSAATPTALPPPSLSRSAAVVAPSSAMSATTTCAPAVERRSAMANPIPRAAPVTIATLPGSSRNTVSLLSLHAHHASLVDAGLPAIRRGRTASEHADDPRVVLGAEARGAARQVRPQRRGGQRGVEALFLGRTAHEAHVLDEDVQGALRGHELLLEHPLAAVLEHEGVGGAMPDGLEDEARVQVHRLCVGKRLCRRRDVHPAE